MTELDVVINFDCTPQNRFQSLETSNQGNKIVQTNNISVSTGWGQKEKISRQPDQFNPKQIKESLTYFWWKVDAVVW